MALENYLLTEDSFTGNEVEGLDDQPNLTAEELKDKFDAASKNVIAPAVNGIINALISGDLNIIKTGWIPVSDTLVFVSVDDPAGVIKVAGKNVTANFKAGMRLKFTNGSNTIYGIVLIDSVLSGSDTVITFLHELSPGTNQARALVQNADITAPYFALPKTYPIDFPSLPDRWQLKTAVSTNSSQNSPAANTWYNVTGLSLVLQAGVWDISYSGTQSAISIASQTQIRMFATLSTGAATESDSEFTAYSGFNTPSGSLTLINPVGRQKKIRLSSKTTLYLNMMTPAANLSQILFSGANVPTIIKALCDYL